MKMMSTAEFSAETGIPQSRVRQMTRDGRLARDDCRCICIPDTELVALPARLDEEREARRESYNRNRERPGRGVDLPPDGTRHTRGRDALRAQGVDGTGHPRRRAQDPARRSGQGRGTGSPRRAPAAPDRRDDQWVTPDTAGVPGGMAR